MKLITLFFLLTCGLFAKEMTLVEVYADISQHRDQLTSQISSLEHLISQKNAQLNAISEQVEYAQRTVVKSEQDAQLIASSLLEVSQLPFVLSQDRAQVLVEKFNTRFDKIAEVQGTGLIKPHLRYTTVFNQDGKALKGEVTRFGPLAYFKGEQANVSGFVLSANGLLLLKEEKASEQLQPVYFSAKEAFYNDDEGLITHLKKGKAAMVPMLILAFVCLVVAIFRSLALLKVVKHQYEKEIVSIAEVCEQGSVEEALILAQALPQPLQRIISEGVKHHALSKEHLEEVLYERVTLEIPVLEKWLTVLSVGASAAPLLGLLGTVTGMIHTFALITQYGSGDASVLSSGISEALITTEVGLVIAIPALIVHAWLSRKVSHSISLTQKGALIFVNSLKIK